jgi:hypothetical protein
MLARIADDLSRGIKTHRLRVQEIRAEDIRVMAFEPRGGIGDERKRSRVAFRESIAAKAFELREGALGKFRRIAALDHAVHELLFEGGHPARMFEGRHGAAKRWTAQNGAHVTLRYATRNTCRSSVPQCLHAGNQPSDALRDRGRLQGAVGDPKVASLR